MNSLLRLLGLLCLVLVLDEVTVSTDVGELQGVTLFDSPQKAKTFTIKKDEWKSQVETSKKPQQSF